MILFAPPAAHSDEYKHLEQAHEKCKHILAYVNQAVKECENYHKIRDIQRKLDTKSIEGNTEDMLEIKVLHSQVFLDFFFICSPRLLSPSVSSIGVPVSEVVGLLLPVYSDPFCLSVSVYLCLPLLFFLTHTLAYLHMQIYMCIYLYDLRLLFSFYCIV